MSEPIDDDGPPDGHPPTPAAPAVEVAAAPSSATPADPPPSALVRRERAAGPRLGGGLALAAVLAAALPAGGALWLAGTGSTDALPPPDVPAPPTTTPAPDMAALRRVLEGLEAGAAQAARDAAAIAARADEAERGARLRAVQKQVALARDARRAAGQSGPALKGPFPVDELGDLGGIGFGPTRWLVGRDGAVLLPAATTSPVPLGSSGRDEDPAAITATIEGVAVTLLRRCVPFEPYCVVDVVPVDPPPPPSPIELAPLRALLEAATPTAAPTSAPTAAPAMTTTTTASSASSARGRAVVAGLALLGLGLGLVVARRLQRLGTALTTVAWRLQGTLAGRPSPAGTHGVAELEVLERAIDDAGAAIARLATLDDDGAWRRQRLEAVADLLLAASQRGGLPRLEDDARDDAGTARVVAASRALLDALEARHTRLAMGLTEVDGTLRLVSPLAQRLLQLARVEGLPPQAADELTSLGTSLGQRARRPQVMPGLMRDIAALTPTQASIVDVAAAVEPLGDDGARLAARQLEGAATEV